MRDASGRLIRRSRADAERQHRQLAIAGVRIVGGKTCGQRRENETEQDQPSSATGAAITADAERHEHRSARVNTPVWRAEFASRVSAVKNR